MNIDRNLVVIKGEDKTEQIVTWKYANGRICVTFNGGKTYNYASCNVQFYNHPDELDIKDNVVLVKGQPLGNVKKIQKFKEHFRIIYKSDYKELYRHFDVRIVQSCLMNAESKNCFNYLKQIANAVSLVTEDGKKILAEHYNKIDFIREDSVLAPFLNPEKELVSSQPKFSVAPIFPFGFNSSQKQAVRNALDNRISIIEGPPGTGKTQTILNIIANAILRNQTVAVVSSNNSATSNVLEKLQKNEVDFIAAYLGSSKNKEEFIHSQKPIEHNIMSWGRSDQEISDIQDKLNGMCEELDDMLQKKNRLSELQEKFCAIEIEKKYFDVYYLESSDGDIDLKTRFHLNSDKMLKLWNKIEYLTEIEEQPSFLMKIINFFLYGIYNFDFYKNSTERLIAIFQKHFFTLKISELQKEIQTIETGLKDYHFDEKMNKYSELSMQLFKTFLSKKYMGQTIRKTYEQDDLWKNSSEFIEDYPVVLSTTYSLRSSLSKEFIYDYLIVDEASQVDLATGALALSCANRAVIVGDLMQLPNVVPEKMAQMTDSVFGRFQLRPHYRYSTNSLLSSSTLVFNKAPKTLLREHYRCHPSIIGFCNKKFYNNQLIVLTKPNPNIQPLTVYKTVEGNHARAHYNQRQIDVIFNEIIPLQKLDLAIDSIGIISPYRQQVEAIQEKVNKTNVEADTVHKFQGREKDTIILSTVDNVISEFADDPNLLNVAISRAVNRFILVTSGNFDERNTNIGDLINYVEYNNFEVQESEIYSVFDYLYKSYSEKRIELLKKHKRVSEFDSENLMYVIIRKVINQEAFKQLDMVMHLPLKMIIRDPKKLDDKETAFAMNVLTHTDFLLFDKFNKKPKLVIEVDGYAFHANNARQTERDKMKDVILKKYQIPVLRLKTNESGEEQRLTKELQRIFNIV